MCFKKVFTFMNETLSTRWRNDRFEREGVKWEGRERARERISFSR